MLGHQLSPGQSSCHSLLPLPYLYPSRPVVSTRDSAGRPGALGDAQIWLVVMTVVGVFLAPSVEPRDAAQ